MNVHQPDVGERLLQVIYIAAAGVHRATASALVCLGALWRRVMAFFPLSCHFGLLAAAMAIALVNTGSFVEDWFVEIGGVIPDQLTLLTELGYLGAVERWGNVAVGFGAFLALVSLLAFVRFRLTYILLKVAVAGFAALWLVFLYFVVRIPSALHVAAKTFSKEQRNDLWIVGYEWWTVMALVALLFVVWIARQPARSFYGSTASELLLWGDRLVANLRSHGNDPRYRRSLYWAAFIHFFALFLYPLLNRGCMEQPYEIPKGSGQEVTEVVQVKQVKREQLVALNINSPILFDIDPEEKISEELDKETEDTYEASSKNSGKPGAGGGDTGGWPGGIENARIRFIRLEYSGGDWDQDMGLGADYNLLVKVREIWGFKIASNTEHIPISQLKRFPKDKAPPFAFITGKGNISVSSRDIKILRWYCLEEGGMIFADNGGGNFNSSFRHLMRRVFPDKSWIDIANDDRIYQTPTRFPNGAPPLWHHSGSRALGIKHNGRWVVFYHQGDLNDAWKTGHSGITPGLANQAYRMGINVICYSFNQYMELHPGK